MDLSLFKRRNVQCTLVYYLIYLWDGMCLASFGPGLLSLSRQINSSIVLTTWILTARAVAYLVGSLVSFFIQERVDPHKMMALALFIGAGGLVAIPFIDSLVWLCVALVPVGICMGVIDVLLNSLIFRLHSPDKVDPYCQALHFSFGVGCISSPFLVSFVLSKTNGITSPVYYGISAYALFCMFLLFLFPTPNDSSLSREFFNSECDEFSCCSDNSEHDDSNQMLPKKQIKFDKSYKTFAVSELSPSKNFVSYHPVLDQSSIHPDFTTSLPVTPATHIPIKLPKTLSRLDYDLRKSLEPLQEHRSPRSILQKLGSRTSSDLVAIFMSSFFLINLIYSQVASTSFGPAYAVVAPVHFTEEVASELLGAFWGAFTASRLISTALSVCFSAKFILLANCLCCVGGLALIVLYGSSWALLLWVGVALFGLGMGPLFAGIFTFCKIYVNITFDVTGILMLGIGIGDVVGGIGSVHLYDISPVYIWYVCGVGMLCILISLISMWAFCTPRVISKDDHF